MAILLRPYGRIMEESLLTVPYRPTYATKEFCHNHQYPILHNRMAPPNEPIVQ
jgi:hypothetical protein